MTYIEEQQTSVDMISEFCGYNHNPVISENEFFDMENMTGDGYPVIRTRDKRGIMPLPLENAYLLGIEGKKKPFVLWSDNSGLFPGSGAKNLYEVTEIGEAEADAPSGEVLPDNPTSGQYFRLNGELKKYIYQYFNSYPGGERKEWITARFDKSISAVSAESMSNNTYVAIADITASPSSTWINGRGYTNNYPFFFEVADNPTLLGITIQCLNYSYRDISNNDEDLEIIAEEEHATVIRSDDLDKMSEFLMGKPVYFCNSDNLTIGNKLRSAPLHIVGVSNYRKNSSGRWCYVYFEKSEVEAQGISGLLGQHFFDEIGAAPILTVKTSDIKNAFDKNYGGNGYVAFCDLESRELENVTNIGEISEGEKSLVSMGANVIVFPDKKIINTLKTEEEQFSDIQNLEIEKTFSSASAYMKANGTNVSSAVSGSILPTNPTDGQYFIETGDTVVIKQYSEALGRWATHTSYLYINFGEAHGFNRGDAVKIECDSITNHLMAQKSFVISDATSNTITVQCTYKDKMSALSNLNITVKRVLPDMDFIIESNNRLWGCHYGLNGDGEMINEIFASKLGDPFNWYYFANTSIDSYYVSLGADGEFTGAVNYQGTPVFFRQNCIHRILGDYPAQYQIKTLEGYGVRKSCHKSISVMNDIVYYLSPMGMVMYNGGIPVSIAEPFGSIKYTDCVSGDIGNNLYCSMKDENDKWNMFVFDDSSGRWHREDDLRVTDFCIYGDELLCVSNKKIVSINGLYGDKEDDFEWMIQTGEIGYSSPMRKHLLRAVMRVTLGISSRAKIEIQYDNDGIWRYINELRPTGKMKGYAVPVIPHRCDHFSLRVRGKGIFTLQSLTRFWNEGSEYD